MRSRLPHEWCQSRIWAHLKDASDTQVDEDLNGSIETHRGADVLHPVLRIGPQRLGRAWPSGGHTGEAGLMESQPCHDIGEGWQHRSHHRAVEGVANVKAGTRALGGQRLDLRGRPSHDDRLWPIDGGKTQRWEATQDLLNFVDRPSQGEHRAAR